MPGSSSVWSPGGATGGLTGNSSAFAPNAQWGSDSQDPNAGNIIHQPYASQTDPTITPAAWSYSQQDNQKYANVYVGSTSPTHIPQASVNVIVGNIAQKLGLRPEHGVSKEQQVISALMERWGVAPTPNGGNIKQETNDQLSSLLAHATGQNLAPGTDKLGGPKVKGLDDPNAWVAIAKSLSVPVTDSAPATAQKQPWYQVAQNYIATMQQKGTGAISNLQAQLYAGGFYDQPEQVDPSKIKQGNLDSYTVKALGEAIKATSAMNQQGQNVTVQNMLAQGATAAGLPANATLAQAAGGGGAAVNAKSVIHDTQGQLAPSLRSAFEADLGYAPSAAELAQFAKEYQGLQDAHASSAANPNGITFLDPNNIPEIQGIASPTQAAGNFAVNTDTNAYLAHGMANAAALIQNAIGSMGQTPRPLNSDPNLTSAARPI